MIDSAPPRTICRRLRRQLWRHACRAPPSVGIRHHVCRAPPVVPSCLPCAAGYRITPTLCLSACVPGAALLTSPCAALRCRARSACHHACRAPPSVGMKDLRCLPSCATLPTIPNAAMGRLAVPCPLRSLHCNASLFAVKLYHARLTLPCVSLRCRVRCAPACAAILALLAMLAMLTPYRMPPIDAVHHFTEPCSLCTVRSC